MFFNSPLLKKPWFFLIPCFLGLAACGKFLNEKRQEAQTLEVSNAKFACLQDMPESIAEFLRGEIPDSKVRQGFDCAQESLTYFKNKTIGTHGDAYTMEDLRSFFGKYFLKKNNASPEFGHELFKLKKALLGGSERYITKAEIEKLVILLEQIEAETVGLVPHMKTLLGENPRATWSEVNAATLQLKKSVGGLLQEIDFLRSDYSFSDLKKFLDGLERFINVGESFHPSKKISGYVALAEAGHDVLIGEKNNLERIQDWQIALGTATGLYQIGLGYHYFLNKKKIETAVEQQALLTIFETAVELLENSLPLQRQGIITFSSIDTLLDQLASRRLLPLGLSARALKETYKKVILRMLDPQRQGDARGLRGLERVHLLALKHELKLFKLHQQFIDGLPYDNQKSIGFAELQRSSRQYSEWAEKKSFFGSDTLEAENLRQGWKEGQQLLLQDFPVFYNQEGRLVITGAFSTYRQSWASLSKWNLMRALSRALLLGYGREGLTQEGLALWYKDFNQIGIEMRAFDPRAQGAAVRSFKEANFFTARGDGDTLMSARETFDFVSLLLAGGMSSAEYIRQDLIAKGCGRSELDIFGYPWLEENCVRNQLKFRFAEYFNNLPGLVRQIRSMSSLEWNEFFANLMVSARGTDSRAGQLETSELRAAVMILHYTETLMSVYDVNVDGRLSLEELRTAAPRFLGFMKQVSPVSQDTLVSDFFLFLVYKGKKPTLSEYAYFQGEKAFGSLGDVGRDRILRVFKVLKEEAEKK